MRLLQLVAVIAWATRTSSCSAAPRPPKVTLDLGAFTGVESGDITEFLGIPFASARRFRLPQAVGLYLGRYDATAFGPSCPQQVSGMPDPITDTSEDCLTINVVKPTQDSRAKLPVVVWIYGGGFQIGGTVQYNGSSIVSRSIQLGEPVIYVSFNYRLSGFGFLASKEVKKAGVGNLGMHDQIMALRWVQRYIDTFGGDPKKVTIWGESAGAISVALHMLVNDGDNRGLFRAGFMQSGSPPAILGLENGQQYYDDVVKKTDCAKSADTLDCLRAVDYNILKEAIDSSAPSLTDFQSFPLAWQPRVDNVLFSDNPQRLVQKGKVANVPIVTGDCDDEGTLFALAQTNLSTDAHFKEWIKKFALPTAPEQEIDRLLELYPADPTQGSPFDTGTDNAITPQFKRFAAFLGDVIFQAPRRFFLEELPKKQDTYAFLSKRSKSVPVMGAFHGSDVELAFSGDMADYLIRFAATLNPNGDTGISWPKWTIESRDMLLFEDGDVPLSITQDTYREEAIKAVVKVFLEHPV